MFFKKLDNLFPILNHLFLCWIIFLLPFGLFGQTTADSYKNLWDVIQNDTVSNAKKTAYLEVYYQKARKENNSLEQYKALEKKSFLVPFANAALLLHQMHPLVQKMENDSIKGRFLNRSTVFYYDNRDFKNALYYAIASEAFNEEINNLYNLNAVRIDIGNIYSHTRYYDKAVAYYTQAKDYYQTQKDYNNLRSYIVTLYCLSKTYWQLQDIDKLNITIQESEQAIKLLKPKDKQLETAYIAYLNGGLAFLQKNNATAQSYFTKALPAIQQNGDFSNEHVIYLYLGKIAWQQNQKETAVAYFTKIDSLFHQKTFLNYELRATYDYLIAYYKETGQTALQNKATESLMALNQQFEKEQQSITSILHEELDTKKLKNNEVHLQKLLQKSTIGISILGGVLLLIGGYVFYKRYKKQQLHKKSVSKKDTVTQTTAIANTVTTEVGVTENVSEITTEIPEAQQLKQPETKAAVPSPTDLRLGEGLECFEKEKGFLAPTTLDDLAKKLNTTRSTLSPFLNEHKKGFSTYINSLRIQQVVADLKADKELRKKPIKDLAAIYGDLHPKTFASLFRVITGESPSSFIERLDTE
ncbi:helix-turn-helix domain-containing protein [Flavobacterium sp. xlx-214]|uniref:helix-turn-helix domain-containing protein n=1 Tax=unclassified Flavobacterium TaxID=196869 RepID=UPI0013D156AC|nr:MULTISPECIES: helix-turn-helix domain-containing protein [unclassified Flavobacterium]MBA5793022.1 helix-turn-helix domain-containing protein [Flavobacterium sp. xlx-221]QMI84650.1 helix-turn-helix domain-containing protein [Flavobacterium sp. xlx-214]